jgi:hypothetical protein
MEPLPRGANFQRAKLLWEIGLHIAGDPKTPYYGPRDMCISVGSGSAENFKPKLRMSTGSPILAHAVCRGDLEMSMVNPSGSPRRTAAPDYSPSLYRFGCSRTTRPGIVMFT